MRIATTLPASDIGRAEDRYGQFLQLEPVETTKDPEGSILGLWQPRHVR